MIKVYVIAPDKSSGIAFCEVMKHDGILAEFKYHKIRPRVIENKITTSHDIVDDLNNIFKGFDDKTKSVVIACNTLQLWLDDVDKIYKRNVKVYTTFEACDWKFKKLRKKPLWLGTTPLVEKTKNFPTLLSYRKPEIQDLVQELIWRVKMIEGDEYGTAPEVVKKDKNNVALQKLKINIIKSKIIDTIENLKVKNVILGCTELPLVLKNIKGKKINFIDPADVLADYIKSQSVSIIFAGGTISSLANDQGVRSGGQAFDLLERLGEKIPGSYKNINITKSNIVYSRLSENMTLLNHKMILKEINIIAKKEVFRIIITHGTDSMEQTARFLNKKLKKRLSKAGALIILTGSNDDVGSPKSDAWTNLHLAINKTTEYRKGGVFVAFHNRFIPADEVVKEYYNDRYGMSYISKKSLAYKKNVKKFKKQVLELKNKLDKKLGSKKENQILLEYDVNVIRKDHKRFLNLVNEKKPKIIVFRLYHSGTANTDDPKASVSKLVDGLTKEGIACFGATENGEPTDLHLYETSEKLLKAGLVPLYNMLLPVAVHKLKLLQIKANNLDRKNIIDKMLTNYVGEIDESQIIKKDINLLKLS